MYQRILVPIDGSLDFNHGPTRRIALARAGLALSTKFLHVLDELVFTTGFETGATYARNVLPALRQGSERILASGTLPKAVLWHADNDRAAPADAPRRHRRGSRPVAGRSHRHRHVRSAASC